MNSLAEPLRAEIARRRKRDMALPAALRGEPAWDILCDLGLSHFERRDICVTSACIASAVPPTTALRWIHLLIGDGLIRRESDLGDGRRDWLRITPAGIDLLARCFGVQQ